MRPLLLICSLITIHSSLIGQNLPDSGFTNKYEATNQTVKGLKEGKWLDYLNSKNYVIDDTNAPFYCLTVYKGGKENGIKRYYTRDGLLMSEYPYTDGKMNGMAKDYYENGKVKSEYAMKDGISDGVAKEFYESGKLKAESPYKSGKVNGEEKEYYENGTLEIEYPITDGKINGTVKEYYETGKIKIENPYKNDTVDGTVKEYYESGKMKGEYPVKKGLADGTSTEYYENGKVKAETPFKKGKIDGEQKINYADGHVNWIMNYKDSKPTGVAQEFDEKEKIKEEYPCDAGKEKPLDFNRKQDAQNILIVGQKQGRWIDYINADHIVTTDTTAPVYCLTIYICGFEYGIKRYYSRKGILMSADPYLQGKLNGVGKEYYEDGKVKAENTYYDGEFIKAKRYDESGKEIK